MFNLIFISMFLVQVVASPKTVFHERKHHVVTDKENLQERNWISGGKVTTTTNHHLLITPNLLAEEREDSQ